ncbi:MAG: sigma-70 family RNA polymerase sigma factor [Armatimonadetes bacterium]|nr:sigma-70 family RNA polymerase sigma factor [Armatimonadota bacterium]NIM23134.1 sigma-70 family RNA polymerase sigma factor [Armatimonadota bacterium]NIM67002.1 sigma-70 family RNA polymerase sigma factor [Armatimonadota bacterium]NIM75536.1 sigma-70 family RNA polymerase sigma factor [Armatimonadota bacterium]NIN05191.1 sigma-70 family RNA polymerase sigma factor [Armatimonadota bacterium]
MPMEALSYAEKSLKADTPKAAGEGAVLAHLYDQHAAAVYRLLVAMLSSAADAQDALSEVFLAVARRNPGRIQHPRAYLLASARHKAISFLRRRKREMPADPADGRFFDTANLGSDQTLLAHRIETALRELPPEQREVVVLKTYEDLTFAEIAKISRTRPNTVASRYRYAVEKLRRRLQEE